MQRKHSALAGQSQSRPPRLVGQLTEPKPTGARTEAMTRAHTQMEKADAGIIMLQPPSVNALPAAVTRYVRSNRSKDKSRSKRAGARTDAFVVAAVLAGLPVLVTGQGNGVCGLAGFAVGARAGFVLAPDGVGGSAASGEPAAAGIGHSSVGSVAESVQAVAAIGHVYHAAHERFVGGE